MDPDETLKVISCALAHGDRSTASDHAASLRRWLDKGGFEPDWDAYPNAAEYVKGSP